MDEKEKPKQFEIPWYYKPMLHIPSKRLRLLGYFIVCGYLFMIAINLWHFTTLYPYAYAGIVVEAEILGTVRQADSVCDSCYKIQFRYPYSQNLQDQFRTDEISYYRSIEQWIDGNHITITYLQAEPASWRIGTINEQLSSTQSFLLWCFLGEFFGIYVTVLAHSPQFARAQENLKRKNDEAV